MLKILNGKELKDTKEKDQISFPRKPEDWEHKPEFDVIGMNRIKIYKVLKDLIFGHFTVKAGEIVNFFEDKAKQLLKNKFLEELEQARLFDIRKYRGEDLDLKTCLIIPRMGIGDVIATTIAARSLKINFPRCNVGFVDWGYGILKGNQEINKIYNFPGKEALKADFYITFEDKDHDPTFNRMSYIDGILSRSYFFGEIDRRPSLVVDRELRSELESIFEEIRNGKDKPIILINYKSGAISRQIPPKVIQELVAAYGEYYNFVLINHVGEVNQTDELISKMGLRGVLYNLSAHSINPRNYVALISLVDGVITCDSAALHIASGLSKPCVAIFSTIRAQARSYDNTVALNWHYQGKYCESPCSLEISAGNVCPEAAIKNSLFSPCLMDIPIDLIANSLEAAFTIIEGKKFPKANECLACGTKENLRFETLINNFRQYSCSQCGLLFTDTTRPLDYTHTYSQQEHFLLKVNDSYKFPLDRDKYMEHINFKLKVVPKYKLIIRILNFLGLNTNVKLLDVGSGNATIPKFIKDNLGWEVFCTEADESSVEFMNKELGLLATHTTDINKLPADFPKKFDIITSFEVMEHVENPLYFLKDIFGLLSENGFMLFSVPNLMKERFMSQKKCIEVGDYPPHHLSWWTEKSLKTIVSRAGFSNLSLCFYPMYPARLFSLIAPMTSVPIDHQWQKAGEIYNQTRLLWENVQLADSIFVLASKRKTNMDLKKIVDTAFIQTLYSYDGDDFIKSYSLPVQNSNPSVPVS